MRTNRKKVVICICKKRRESLTMRTLLEEGTRKMAFTRRETKTKAMKKSNGWNLILENSRRCLNLILRPVIDSTNLNEDGSSKF